jgi:septal ring factor EnvC (AmiA/AmiB activator)
VIQRRIFFLALLLLATPAVASQQEELANLRRQISSLQKDFEKTNESRSSAADALRESEQAISNSNRRLNDLTEQQHAASYALSQAQIKSAELSQEMQMQRTAIGNLFYQQYIGGQQAPIKLLINNRNPSEISREIQYYKYIARQRANWIKTVKHNLNDLEVAKAEIEQRSKEIAELQNKARTQRDALEKEKLARKKVLAKIGQQLAQQRREIDHLRRNENRLSQLVAQIAKMLAHPPKNTILHNNKLPDSRFDGKSFAALKGKLVFPVKGTITNRYGANRTDSSLPWKGLFLSANTNQPVKAVAAGRVVYADWLRGFGNLLIIDHGNSYMSLYGNNETLFKQVGDIIRGGDTVASVGNSGGNEDSGLYFELRHEGQPFDPLKWVAR